VGASSNVVLEVRMVAEDGQWRGAPTGIRQSHVVIHGSSRPVLGNQVPFADHASTDWSGTGFPAPSMRHASPSASRR
jgi:hypothetical protein